MTWITESAHAKINLFLDITGKREDGYHLLDGVMQTVPLCDEVTIGFEEATALTVSVTCQGNDAVPCNEKNIAYRAAVLLMTKLGKTGTVSVHIEKRIPVAAGLAGGSADGAAVLRGLNRLLGSPLTVAQLQTIAVGLGADLPFCVVGGTYRTQGVGEILSPCSPMPGNFEVLVCCGGEGVSTPWAYGTLDERYENFKDPYDHSRVNSFLESLGKQNTTDFCNRLFNIFEEPISKLRPAIQKIKSVMLSHGASAAMMSGSGPAVFGLFLQNGSVVSASAALEAEGFKVY